MHSDVWRFPISGSAAENVRNGTQLTRQTAHVQTPSASPDGKEIAYLSNSGGQGTTDGGPMRQITDFGRRAILIARTVSWSSDSQSVYAAVAEMDADIVLLEGIGQPSR